MCEGRRRGKKRGREEGGRRRFYSQRNAVRACRLCISMTGKRHTHGGRTVPYRSFRRGIHPHPHPPCRALGPMWCGTFLGNSKLTWRCTLARSRAAQRSAAPASSRPGRAASQASEARGKSKLPPQVPAADQGPTGQLRFPSTHPRVECDLLQGMSLGTCELRSRAPHQPINTVQSASPRP